MREVGAFEAKNKLGQLLDWVEAGEAIVITAGGGLSHVLCLRGSAFDRERGRRAAQNIREMRKGISLGALRIMDLINEGHR